MDVNKDLQLEGRVGQINVALSDRIKQWVSKVEEELLGNNMTDFFHSRPVEYSKKSQSFDEDDLF